MKVVVWLREDCPHHLSTRRTTPNGVACECGEAVTWDMPAFIPTLPGLTLSIPSLAPQLPSLPAFSIDLPDFGIDLPDLPDFPEPPPPKLTFVERTKKAFTGLFHKERVK